MSRQIEANRPYALAGGEGRPMAWFTSRITLKASSRDIGVTEVLMSPGEEPPLHVHKNENEWLYVLEGAMTFHVGGENHFGETGAFISFPRGIPHTFSVETPQARHLVVNTPGGFERMFELAPKTPEEAERALTGFGMEVIGPHPRQVVAAV